jgi:aspartate aminotransferase
VTTRPFVLASRIERLAVSPTMQVAIEADRLKRAGADLVDLGAGEPDFPTPAHVIAAAHAALDAQFTKYTVNMGTAELRAAVAARYLADNGVRYDPADVIITAGGKQALFHAAFALFGPGDEVITHTPGWPTLGEQIKLAGAEPILVHTPAERGFAITAADLLGAVTPRTRGFVLNSPANPTGALLSESEARILAREAARRDLWVVLDLCYDRLVYGGVSHNLAAVFDALMRDRLLICGSASKVYAMTGWRCGWLAGPRDVVQAANALQSHETSNASSIAQKAALAALTGPQDCVAEMRDTYEDPCDRLLAWLGREPRLAAHRPQGAFYLFPSVQAFLSPACPTSLEFAARLLREAHVVATPGEAFHAPGYLRLSYAASLDRLEAGASRLIRFAQSLT